MSKPIDPDFAAFIVELLPEMPYRKRAHMHGVDLYESPSLTGWNLFVEIDYVALYYDTGADNGGSLYERHERGFPEVPPRIEALLKRVQDKMLLLT